MRPRFDVVPNLFTSDECDFIIKTGRKNLKDASFGNQKERWFPSLQRRSKVSWFSNGSNPEIDVLIQRAIAAMVETSQFHHGIVCNEYEDVQFTEYRTLGHYGMHKDVSITGPYRLISATIELSPKGSYIGGGLSINSMFKEKDIKADQGSMVVFPSILDHKAKTVFWGKRNSLVLWGQYRDDT